MSSVLVVEDDGAIGRGLVDELESHGYAVAWARTGAEALDRAGSNPPDAVLLDLGLPDIDGVQICRSLRRALPSVPIIMLTARDAEIDIVVGLDAGANDYVTKPFSVHVLLARLRAHLRTAADPSPGALVFDDLKIDVEGFRAVLDESEIPLRPKEMSLLIRLATSAGRVISREQLLDDVWDLHWESDTKTLEVHVHALRRKLGPRPDGRAWITTVRNIGYRFEP
jgi:DNA-binding response OmpR family regulator